MQSSERFRVEAKEASLRQMLSTVKRDKEKIEDTIGKINGYKMDALNKTWSKVNEYELVWLSALETLEAYLRSYCQEAFASSRLLKGNPSATALKLKCRWGACGSKAWQNSPAVSGRSLLCRSSCRFFSSSRHPCTSWMKSMLPWTCPIPKTLAVSSAIVSMAHSSSLCP